MTDPEEIEYVATRIEFAYRTERSKKQGRPYRGHPEHDKPEVWQKAAELCLELDAQPEDFVRAAFQYAKHGPYPKHMYGKAMRRWYSDYQRTYAVKKGQTFDHWVVERTVSQTIKYCQDSGRPLEEHLSDPDIQFPAWCRVLLCPTKYHVRRRFLAEAKAELLRCPALERGLKELGYDTSIYGKEFA